MKKRLIMLILLISTIQASQYYADLTIKVDNSGFTTITGNTNYPNLTINDYPGYTSKKGNYWMLNITKPEQFSEFIYTIQLPETASINYIKTTGTVNIQNQGTTLIIKGYGENKQLSIIIQYQINKTKNNFLETAIIITTLIIILIIFQLFYKKKKTKTKKTTNKKKQTRILPLPERQKQIMKLLTETNKPLTQAQIRKKLKIPKASTSRNINSLELKGLITKEKIGITNIIKIKKQ